MNCTVLARNVKTPALTTMEKVMTGITPRVVHFYKVVGGQMVCVNCGRNIINTNYGDRAAEVSSGHRLPGEVTCSVE